MRFGTRFSGSGTCSAAWCRPARGWAWPIRTAPRLSAGCWRSGLSRSGCGCWRFHRPCSVRRWLTTARSAGRWKCRCRAAATCTSPVPASIAPEGTSAYVGDIDGQIRWTMAVVDALLKSRNMTWDANATRAVAYFPDIRGRAALGGLLPVARFVRTARDIRAGDDLPPGAALRDRAGCRCGRWSHRNDPEDGPTCLVGLRQRLVRNWGIAKHSVDQSTTIDIVVPYLGLYRTDARLVAVGGCR